MFYKIGTNTTTFKCFTVDLGSLHKEKHHLLTVTHTILWGKKIKSGSHLP
jgi:hypothetical protein